ncbi:hypothetical protein ANN_13183 [Periplaneta americana]|uniref:Mos1 transposase HTH domain-containing protein n=1 Tax=Periplaneta americana TaxID=6978 RepID=A0ABQ8TJ38_PERAM|nr:hypothetical protein ANN_13183 [Periplaneta americana]
MQAENGGLMMVAFYPHFISCSESATLHDVVGQFTCNEQDIEAHKLRFKYIFQLKHRQHENVKHSPTGDLGGIREFDAGSCVISSSSNVVFADYYTLVAIVHFVLLQMNDVIDNPADCEVRSVIRFLNARHLKPAEIYRQLKEVYGDTVMNERNVKKWCEMFSNGRTNVHVETRPGRPSLITEDLKTKVNDRILQDMRTSLDELHIAFPDISRSLLGEIVSQHLGYHKICARWVPRQLSDQHKTQRMASALTYLMRYHTDGDSFLDQIVTADETWESHNTPETKRQSRQWHHPSSPKKP